MSFLDSLQNKLEYIKEFDKYEIVKIVDESLNRTKNSDYDSDFDNYKAQIGIKLDLAYLFLRYRFWCNSSLFRNLLIDFLQSEYSIEASKARYWVDIIATHIIKYLPDTAPFGKDHDKDFIFELLCICISTTQSKELPSRLGFGKNVIQIIEKTLELSNHSKTDRYMFPNDTEQKIQRVLVDLSKKQASTPWFGSLCKLRVTTSEMALQQSSPLSFERLEVLFNCLVQIDLKGTKVDDLKALLNTEPMKNPIYSPEQIIDLLQTYKLTYTQIKHTRCYIVHLTHAGLRVVHDAHVDRALGKAKSKPESITQLPEDIQAEVLKVFPSEASHSYDFFVRHGHKLSPKGILSLMDRLKGGIYSKNVIEYCEKIIWNIENLWTRAAICEALTEYKEFSLTRKILRPVAQQDPSPKVRKIARDFVVAKDLN